jgi:hypothetical protein
LTSKSLGLITVVSVILTKHDPQQIHHLQQGALDQNDLRQIC